MWSIETAIPDLEAHLRAYIAAIPPGYAASCGTLAELLGDRQAARWIGSWLLDHSHDEACPCHRVVRAGGRLGGFILGVQRQRELLVAEGLALTGDAISEAAVLDATALKKLIAVQGEPPLARLQQFQRLMRSRICVQPVPETIRDCAGVDVSYRAGYAVAVYCRVTWPDGEKRFETHVVQRVRFPYITGYLAFRELTPMLEVIRRAEAAGQLADVILVDGSGLLHPRGMGVASHLGVILDRPTIGVTKTLLCGTTGHLQDLAAGESMPILWQGQTLGAVLRSLSGHAQPVFLSIGHRVDVPGSLRVVRPLFARHRLPEPIYWADRLSRAIARKL